MNNTVGNKEAITQFQVTTIQKLIAERRVPLIVRDLLNEKWAKKDFTREAAFKIIENLYKLPHRDDRMNDVEELRVMVGIHVLDGKVFEVKLSKNNNLYAREITENGERVYAPQVMKDLSLQTKMI